MEIKILLVNALYYFNYFLTMVIFVRCILSWFPIKGDNIIIKLIYGLTEPILGPIRRLLEKSPIGQGYMIDFSPVIAYIFLEAIVQILIAIILSL